MQEKITTTTATSGLGQPPGRKLLRVPTGQYQGRLVALIHTAAGDIKYSYADRPYSSWSSLTTIDSSAADEPFDARMTTDGDIHLVYSESGSKYLVTRKLVFTGGTWSVGSKVIVYNGDVCLYPSIDVESDGTLWVSWSRQTGGLKTIYIKSSTDDGATWGTGPSDAGTALTGGASSAYSRVIIGPGDIHVVYTDGGLQLSIRSLPIGGGSWSSEYNIATGTQFDEHFDVAIAADGRLGVTWDEGSLKYREYDNAAWGVVVTLDSGGGTFPQLMFSENVPIVVYLSPFASDQKLLKYTTRQTETFSTPAPFDGRAMLFDSVVLYDASTSAYADLSSEAASATTADVYHPGSSALVGDSGDAIYLGMDERFRYVNLLLSTASGGGTVVYSYWDGSNWSAFTPSGGAFNLDATDRDLLLWEDFNTVPQNWQKCVLNGDSRFWVKVEVDSSFTTPPVGSQITAISDIQALIVRR